jgi:hypothetical protein
MMAQSSYNPALDNLYADFRFSLVAGPCWPPGIRD